MTLALTTSIHIRAPAATVFAVVSTPERLPEWNVSVELARRAVTGAPIALGSRAIIVGRLLGQRIDSETEVSVLEEPSRFETRAVRGPRLTTRFALSEVGGGSRLEVMVSGEVPGGAIGERLAEGVLRRELTLSLDRLRWLCESETLGSPTEGRLS